MKRRLSLFILFALVAGCGGGSGGSTAPAAVAGSFEKLRFTSVELPDRDYWLYQPATLTSNAPLVVYLHGCNQRGDDVAVGTRWNELAERLGFAVLYPEQKNPNDQEFSQEQTNDQAFDGNGASCWNWFRPEHIGRDVGEAGTIAAITRDVMALLESDSQRVFVMGLSAGAIMAGTMAANYPDIFAALGIVAGCGFPACSDPSGELALQAMAANARRLPVVIFQGTADEIQPYATGREALQQWLGTNDRFDDGQANGSVSATAAHTRHFGVDDSALSGVGNIGDLCIRNSNSPCPSGALGISENYPWTHERFNDARDCPLIDFWSIHGLAHNYPGGDIRGSFTDPVGPDITAAAFAFFMAQAKGGVFENTTHFCADSE